MLSRTFSLSSSFGGPLLPALPLSILRRDQVLVENLQTHVQTHVPLVAWIMFLWLRRILGSLSRRSLVEGLQAHPEVQVVGHSNYSVSFDSRSSVWPHDLKSRAMALDLRVRCQLVLHCDGTHFKDFVVRGSGFGPAFGVPCLGGPSILYSQRLRLQKYSKSVWIFEQNEQQYRFIQTMTLPHLLPCSQLMARAHEAKNNVSESKL